MNSLIFLNSRLFFFLRIRYLILISSVVYLSHFQRAQAQTTGNGIFYANGGMIIGNYWGPGFGLNFLPGDKVSFHLQSCFLYKKAENLPSDIYSNPHKQAQNYGLLVGLVKKSEDNTGLRLMLKGGFGLSSFQRPVNFEKTQGLIFHFYTWDMERRNAFSVIVNPEISYLGRLLGFSGSVYLNVNRETSIFGVSANILIGTQGSRRGL